MLSPSDLAVCTVPAVWGERPTPSASCGSVSRPLFSSAWSNRSWPSSQSSCRPTANTRMETLSKSCRVLNRFVLCCFILLLCYFSEGSIWLLTLQLFDSFSYVSNEYFCRQNIWRACYKSNYETICASTAERLVNKSIRRKENECTYFAKLSKVVGSYAKMPNI